MHQAIFLSITKRISVEIELIPFERINTLFYHTVQFSFLYLQSLNGKQQLPGQAYIIYKKKALSASS